MFRNVNIKSIYEETTNFVKNNFNLKNLIAIPVIFIYFFLIGLIWLEGIKVVLVLAGAFLVYKMI